MLVAFGLALAAPPAAAGEGATGDPLAIARARLAGGRAHLWRNLVWGATSLVGGGALALASDRDQHPTRWAFGVQSAVWGGIDVGIGVTGLVILAGPPSERGLAAVIDKERLFHDALLLNMGLDVGYIGLGATLWFAASRGADGADELRGHGQAIMVQGAALLSFEVLAWLSSRRRLGRLLELDLAVAPASGGRGLALGGRF